MRRADRITAAVLLALAVVFSAGALRHYAYWSANGPGPAFLPFWLGVVMAVLALLLLVGAWRERDAGEPWLPRGEGLRRLLLVLVSSAVLVALLEVLGMALATALYLAVVLRGLDRHPWPLTLAVAAGTAAFDWLVFNRWLKVPLPVGPLGF